MNSSAPASADSSARRHHAAASAPNSSGSSNNTLGGSEVQPGTIPEGFGYVARPSASGYPSQSVMDGAGPYSVNVDSTLYANSGPFDGKRTSTETVGQAKKRHVPGHNKGVKASPMGTKMSVPVPSAPVRVSLKGFANLVHHVAETLSVGLKRDQDRQDFIKLCKSASAFKLLRAADKYTAKFRPASFEVADMDISLPVIIAAAIGGFSVCEKDSQKFYVEYSRLERSVETWMARDGFPDWANSNQATRWAVLVSTYETSTRRSDAFSTDIPEKSLLLTTVIPVNNGTFWNNASGGVKVACRDILPRRYELIAASLGFNKAELGGAPWLVALPHLNLRQVHLYPALASSTFSLDSMTTIDLDQELLS